MKQTNHETAAEGAASDFELDRSYFEQLATGEIEFQEVSTGTLLAYQRLKLKLLNGDPGADLFEILIVLFIACHPLAYVRELMDEDDEGSRFPQFKEAVERFAACVPIDLLLPLAKKAGFHLGRFCAGLRNPSTRSNRGAS